MQRLIDGYARFRKDVYPNQKSLFQELSKGQKPEVLFISCSDSRVMPEMILQNGPGEVFSIRNAGNLVPAHDDVQGGVSATVEYAVAALKVIDIVVCGHSGCGAMKEILEQAHVKDLPLVQAWLKNAGNSAQYMRTLLNDNVHSPEEKLKLLTEANVVTQMSHLEQHPAVKAQRAEREVNIHGWVLDIGSGEIRCFNPTTGTFQPLNERYSVEARELQYA